MLPISAEVRGQVKHQLKHRSIFLSADLVTFTKDVQKNWPQNSESVTKFNKSDANDGFKIAGKCNVSVFFVCFKCKYRLIGNSATQLAHCQSLKTPQKMQSVRYQRMNTYLSQSV